MSVTDDKTPVILFQKMFKNKFCLMKIPVKSTVHFFSKREMGGVDFTLSPWTGKGLKPE